MTNRFFRKVTEGWGDCLVPIDDDTNEWLGKKKEGAQFRADMKASRNPGHHRKAFALFKIVADNHPTYETVDEVLLEMKLRSNHYQEHVRAGNSRSANRLREGIAQHIDNEILFNDMMDMVENLEREAKLVYMPKSISFDQMGQEEFEELYEAWIPIACNMIGVKDEEIRGELAQF